MPPIAMNSVKSTGMAPATTRKASRSRRHKIVYRSANLKGLIWSGVDDLDKLHFRHSESNTD
ncbi:hypothetical protein HID58_051471 [Brassica napus]|uniref:Uncharacterized protein n=1 Tax=Brassica napus TaxID=3708 RepID=A0ABQ8A9P8_BRANA|nr:hypothetical protein HID58_051471 [Brassica napus]